jgi:hypothetical protein
MPIMVLTDVFLSIGGVDLSDHVDQVTLSYSADVIDKTAFGTAGTRQRVGGLKDWSMSFQVQSDEAAGSVSATLFPLVGATTAVIMRPKKATAVSATNPNYQGNAVLENFNPLDGGIGELARSSSTLQGDGLLTRATS